MILLWKLVFKLCSKESKEFCAIVGPLEEARIKMGRISGA